MQVVLFLIACAVAMLAALGVAGVVWACARDVRVGIVLVLTVFLMDAILLHSPAINIGVSLYAADVVFVMLLLAGAINVSRWAGQSRVVLVCWIVLGGMLFLSFARGLPLYGTMAGVEFREYFYMWTGVLYFMNFSFDELILRFTTKAFAVAAGALVLLVFYRWLVGAFGLARPVWLEQAEHSRFRVIRAHEAYVLAQTFAVGVYYHVTQRSLNKRAVFGVAVLGFCVVALQHRTVWVVTAVMLLTFAVVDPAARRHVGRYAASLLALVMLAAIPIAVFFSGLADTIYHASVVEPFSERSTLVWRLQSWHTSVSGWANAGPMEWLGGFPFGAGFYRYVEAQRSYVDVYPHSYYVTTLLRVGALGATALFGAYALALARAWAPRREHMRLAARYVLSALLVGQLVFYVSYNPSFIQAAVLGIAVSMVFRAAVNKDRSMEKVKWTPPSQ